MENKNNIKNKLILENKKTLFFEKKKIAFFNFFAEIGFFIPVIFFLSITYLLGFLKWGLFYEKDALTIVILGGLSLVFSLFLLKKDNFLINNFLIKFKNKKIIILFFLNCLFILISIFFSTYKYASLIYYFKFLLVAAFFIFGMIFSTSENLKKIFFKFYEVVSWALAIWVLLGSFYLTYFINKEGFQNAAIRFLSTFALNGLNRGLLGSIFGYSNTLASFLGCFIFVTIFFLLKEKNITQKFIQFLKLTIFVVGFQLTQSRASFLLLILCGGILGFLLLFREGGKNRRLSFVILFLLIIFFGTFFFTPSREIISSILFPKTLQAAGEYSIRDRINLVKDGLKYFSENFIFGTGPGTYEYNFYLYRTNLSANVQTTDPHSFLITELGEGGIIGTLLLFSLIGYLLLKTLRKIKEQEKAYLVLIFAIIFGILHAFIDWDWLFFLPLLNLFLIFGFSYGSSFSSLRKQEEAKKDKPFNFKIIFVILILAISVSSYLFIARINFEKIRAKGGEGYYFADKAVPFNLDYALLKAKIFSLSGKDLSLTEKYFEKSTQIVPGYFLPWKDYTNYFLSLKDEKALTTALKLVELSPYNYSSNYLLAKVYYLSKNYEKAKEFSQKAMNLSPEDADSKVLFGKAEIALKKPREAIPALLAAYGKDSSREETIAALFEAYGLLKDTRKQLYFVGESMSDEQLTNNKEIFRMLREVAPAVAFTNVNESRQYNIQENDIFKITWEILGVNMEKASKVVLGWKNLQTGQEAWIGDMNVNKKSYEFVLTPGTYQVNIALFTKDVTYIDVLKRNWLNRSTLAVTVMAGDAASLSGDKISLLTTVATANLKITPSYFPADYVLGRLSKNKNSSYKYLVKAFNEQGMAKGDENIYAALNGFIQFAPFKGIEENSIQKYDPLTLLFEKKNLDVRLFSRIDFFAIEKDGAYHLLGQVYTKNIIENGYKTFLRTWELDPGQHQIYVHPTNSFIEDNKFSTPEISFTLNVENSELKVQKLDEYLTLINNRIMEEGGDVASLSYIKGFFEKERGENSKAEEDFIKAYENDATLFEAKKQYLSLFPQAKIEEVKIESITYKNIYLDTPFIASWKVSNRASLTWANDISFILFDGREQKHYLFASGEARAENMAVEDFNKNIPEGTYQLEFSTLSKRTNEEYTEKDLVSVVKTNYYIVLHKTKMPNNLISEAYMEAAKYYKESPNPNYDLVYWLGNLALRTKDYKMLTYYFNICGRDKNRAAYCSKILEEKNLPEILSLWTGRNGSNKNEVYMPLDVGFMEKTADKKLFPMDYKIEILDIRTLKVLQTFDISDYRIWTDNTVFVYTYPDLPANNYYLKITIDKIKDGRNLKIVSYCPLSILGNKSFEYTEQDLIDFEYLVTANPTITTANCILARINFYKNNYNDAIKYTILAQEDGYKNCLEPASIGLLMKEGKNLNYGEWTLIIKNVSYSAVVENLDRKYKFIDILARNKEKDGWSYLNYEKENNTLLFPEDSKNKNFDKNSEYAILAQGESGDILFLPMSELIEG